MERTMFAYGLPVSLYTHKLRLAALLMGLDLEIREPPGGSYRSPDYLALVPAGTIPALVDGDLVLVESDAIIEYLGERGGGAPILAGDARTRARHRMLSRWSDLRLEAAVRRLFGHIAPLSRNPTAVAAADAEIARAIVLIETGLDASGPFACGPRPGLADCALAAALSWHDALTGPLALASRPGPRLAGVMSSITSHSLTRDEIAAYAARVAAWVRAKSAG
jgi:glutathione S-transferase